MLKLTEMVKNKPKNKLKRSIGLNMLTFFGVGNIVGAGIYVLIGKVAGVAGYSTPLAFVIAMIIAGLTALSYMELSSRYPQAAGVSAYIHGAFGSKVLSFSVGMLMVAGGIVSAAVLARGFGGYLSVFLPLPQWLMAVFILLVLGTIALWGIGESVRLAVIFTVLELIGLAMVIWSGREYLLNINQNISYFTQIDPSFGIAGVITGAFLAFYAFIGFEDMVSVAEEVKRPRRTMPLGIISSLGISTILYIAVVVIAISAIPPQQLATSNAPLSLVFSHTAGSSAVIISIIGISAAINGILAHLLGTSRLIFGLAKRGWLHHKLARVHMIRKTPVLATIATVGAMVIMTIILPLESLARLTSFLLLCIFISINLALIVIKRRKSRPSHVVTMPVWVPYAGLLSSAGLILYQIVHR